MENSSWKIVFYIALAVLVVVLYIKKRRQVKDTLDIDEHNHTNAPEE